MRVQRQVAHLPDARSGARRAGGTGRISRAARSVSIAPPECGRKEKRDGRLHGEERAPVDAERVPVDAERVVRVASGAKRNLNVGPDGVRILAPGRAGEVYERPEPFKLGAPDPHAGLLERSRAARRAAGASDSRP